MDETPDSGGSLGLALWEVLITVIICFVAAVVMVRVFSGTTSAFVAAVWGMFWGIFAGMRVSRQALYAGFIGLAISMLLGWLVMFSNGGPGLVSILFAVLNGAAVLFFRLQSQRKKLR